jgi:hypothetical protein
VSVTVSGRLNRKRDGDELRHLPEIRDILSGIYVYGGSLKSGYTPEEAVIGLRLPR